MKPGTACHYLLLAAIFAIAGRSAPSSAADHEPGLWAIFSSSDTIQSDDRPTRWQQGTRSMRVRLEERSVSTGDDLGVILRYMARYTRPVG